MTFDRLDFGRADRAGIRWDFQSRRKHQRKLDVGSGSVDRESTSHSNGKQRSETTGKPILEMEMSMETQKSLIPEQRREIPRTLSDAAYLWICFLIAVVLLPNILLSCSDKQGVQPVQEKVAAVVVGHGLAAQDFPPEKLRQYRQVAGQVMEAGGEIYAPSELVQRMNSLVREMRQWKRTPKNDPYDASVKALATRIQQLGGFDIAEVAHNEACGLDVEEAIDNAVNQGATQVIVISTMSIKGGTHSEQDIADKVEKAKGAHPGVKIAYAWPFDIDQLARFFVEQADRFRKPPKDQATPQVKDSARAHEGSKILPK